MVGKGGGGGYLPFAVYERRTFWAFSALSSLFMFGCLLFVPYMAPYVKAALADAPLYGIPVDIWLGIIFAAYPLAVVFGIHALGALADDIGRTRVILIGLLLSAIGAILMLVGLHPIIFILARVFEALGYTTVLVIALAKINDLTKDKERGVKQGLFLSLQQIGAMLAPLVGSWLVLKYSLRMPYIAGLIIIAILAIYLATHLHKHRRHVQKESLSIIKNWKQFLGFRQLKGMAFLGAAMNAHTPALIIFLPLLILERFPGRYEYVGYAFFCLALFKPLQFVSGKIIDKHGKRRLTIVGSLIVALALFLIPTTSSLPALLGVILLLAFGNTFWNVGAWTIMSDIGEANHIEGHVVGSYASIAKVGDFLGSLAFGAIAAALGTAFVFTASGYLAALGILVALFFWKE